MLELGLTILVWVFVVWIFFCIAVAITFITAGILDMRETRARKKRYQKRLESIKTVNIK